MAASNSNVRRPAPKHRAGPGGRGLCDQMWLGRSDSVDGEWGQWRPAGPSSRPPSASGVAYLHTRNTHAPDPQQPPAAPADAPGAQQPARGQHGWRVLSAYTCGVCVMDRKGPWVSARPSNFPTDAQSWRRVLISSEAGLLCLCQRKHDAHGHAPHPHACLVDNPIDQIDRTGLRNAESGVGVRSVYIESA